MTNILKSRPPHFSNGCNEMLSKVLQKTGKICPNRVCITRKLLCNHHLLPIGQKQAHTTFTSKAPGTFVGDLIVEFGQTKERVLEGREIMGLPVSPTSLQFSGRSRMATSHEAP